MNVHCPHCRKSVEFVDDVDFVNLACPSCGSFFNLLGDASTVSRDAGQVETIAHFELLETVGVGAFGAVWKARDIELDRIVALKIPRAQLSPGKDREQFLREARTAAQLRHPNIVTVHEVGRHERLIYIASDFIQGVTLADQIDADRPGPRASAQLCAVVAEALDHAHRRGVVHRDLKPSNILIDAERRPYIVDFGLAKRESAEVTITLEGRVLGTPAFMSPEQARGEAHHVDGRSDIYSLGVILYQLLTGELPFRGNKRMLLHQVMFDDPRPPRSFNDRLPRDLDTITMKAMAKEPSRRYATAQELADDLGRYLEGRPIVARPVGRTERAWRWARRNPLVATLISVTAAAMLLTTIVSAVAYDRTRGALDGEIIARQEAERRRNEAQQALAREAQQRKETLRQQQRAEANFRRARRAVDDYMTKVSENRLLDELALQPLRNELLEEALRYYGEFLNDRGGDDPQIKAEVASAYLRISQLQSTIGETDQSLESLGHALALVDEVMASGEDVTNYASWIAGVFRGPRYNRRNQVPPSNPLGAVTLIKKGSVMWEKLVAQAPDVPGFRQDLAGFYFYLGLAIHALGNRPGAADQMRQAEQLLRTLRDEYPDERRYGEEWAYAVATLGEMHEVAAKPDEALAIYEGALAECPESLILCNQTAQFYANYTDPRYRRPEKALQLALHATKLAPRDAEAWSTLGTVYYRLGEWQMALDSLEKSMQLRDGGDAWDWFHRAMVQWKLGQQEEARKWYAQAAAWAGQTPINRRQIRRLYHEAAAVLGEPPPPDK